MNNSRYSITIGQRMTASFAYYRQGTIVADSTTTKTEFVVSNRRFSGGTTDNLDIMWRVSGMSARGASQQTRYIIKF